MEMNLKLNPQQIQNLINFLQTSAIRGGDAPAWVELMNEIMLQINGGGKDAE